MPVGIRSARASPVVLYARRDSVYKSLGVPVFDEDRDARCYLGRSPVVAHPPCRMWGRLRRRAKGSEAERQLAVSALWVVRLCGGVLEHPAGSLLWCESGLPLPGERPDRWGGYTIAVRQSDFGHAAPKLTWLYGCRVVFPLYWKRDAGVGRVELMGKREREATPLPFAQFLLETAASARALLTFMDQESTRARMQIPCGRSASSGPDDGCRSDV